MRLEMVGKKVCVSLEDKNSQFLSACHTLFDGYYGAGYLKLRHNQSPYEYFEAEANYRALKKVIALADEYGIEIEDAVIAYKDELEARVEELNRQYYAEQEREQMTALWKKVQKRGCKGCKHLCRTGYDDEYFCAASGERLEIKDVGLAANGGDMRKTVYDTALFRLEPFPTDGCEYKTDDNFVATMKDYEIIKEIKDAGF